jgi:FG-GAP-like repeat/FG-GAP repeat
MRFPLFPSFRVGLLAILINPAMLAQTFSFSAPKLHPLPSGNTAGGIVPLDLDGDGNTDVAVRLDSGDDYVYLGDGKGGFKADPVPLRVDAFQIFTDLNGDGKADVLILDSGSPQPYEPQEGQFSVLLGDGKGNFNATTYIVLPHADTWTYTLGDFNNDGRTDVAYMDISSSPADGETSLFIFLNKGNGVFEEDLHKPLDHSPRSVVTGDFDGDGKTDIAWADGDSQAGSGRYLIHYMYGNGDGSFQPERVYTIDGQPVPMFAVDLNRDHRTDLAVVVYNTRGRFASLLAKQTTGFYWSSNLNYARLSNARELTDFNGDGQPDLLVAFPYVLFPGEPGGRFGVYQGLPSGLVNPVFTPLTRGGLPAIFDVTADGTPPAIRVFVNTSRK